MRMRGVVFGALLVVGCAQPKPPPAPLDAAAAPPVDPSALGATASASAGGKPFGAPCTTDAECGANVCFHKRLKGGDAGPEKRSDPSEAVERDGYCSLRCKDDADCPVPPTKRRCGARGMCKRPE